jgi:hypothetical protein
MNYISNPVKYFIYKLLPSGKKAYFSGFTNGKATFTSAKHQYAMSPSFSDTDKLALTLSAVKKACPNSSIGVDVVNLSDFYDPYFAAYKKPRAKNPVKRKNPKKKNPVSSLIKVFRHGQGGKSFTQKGYFTGTGWDTSVSKAAKFSAGEAKRTAQILIDSKKIPDGWGVAIVSG